MCKEFDVARKVATYYAVYKTTFTTDELKHEINAMGGVYMVSSRESIFDFLDDFVRKGYLEYDEINDSFINKSANATCLC